MSESGIALEAQLENQDKGAYHGYPTWILRIRLAQTSNYHGLPMANDYAHLARSSWDVGTSPVSNRQLAQLFGIQEREFGGHETLRPVIRLGIGARDKQDARLRLKVALSTHRPEARRFEFARILGDAVNVGFDDVWRPVTNMKTRRQQMQRGFAAEFLCPTAGLTEYFSKRELTALSDSDIDDASQEFQVSTRLIERQIENHLHTRRAAVDRT